MSHSAADEPVAGSSNAAADALAESKYAQQQQDITMNKAPARSNMKQPQMSKDACGPTRERLAENLRAAAAEGKVELARLLLRCGAEPNAQDEQVSLLSNVCCLLFCIICGVCSRHRHRRRSLLHLLLRRRTTSRTASSTWAPGTSWAQRSRRRRLLRLHIRRHLLLLRHSHRHRRRPCRSRRRRIRRPS